jgi:serine/threonine/tyrosine protein kinase RAD53
MAIVSFFYKFDLVLGCVVGRALTRLGLVDLVLEYIEGGNLLDFILTHDGLSECMAQHITSQICSTLSVCPQHYGLF